ncbi:MAG: hypothetical protein LBK22_02085 [Tannerella sp.]|jgi:hypothetical protein|nr:hypothetical protein [Tannerella sp.]
MKRKKLLFALSGAVFVLVTAGSYITWNRLEPERTCARCHEIAPTHARWKASAHADVHCIECHGTAVSGGFHSLQEKVNMVFTHFTGDRQNEDIRLSERQALEIHRRCIACHQSEHAGWLAGGHAVDYREIFMDSVHNATEKPYWDCLRCHGMFYGGNIHDLMALEDTSAAHWRIRDREQESLPAIPCLACHEIHTDNPVSRRYVADGDSSRTGIARNPRTALYMRADRRHMRADMLPVPVMYDGDAELDAASDPVTRLCMQCHAPGFRHQAGSEDDRTVTGVHQGIGCIACHRPHSGDTGESCAQCHPSLTREQIAAVLERPHGY